MQSLGQLQRHSSGPAIVSGSAKPRRREGCGNLLLRSLDPEAFDWVSGHLEQVPARHGSIIVAPSERITFVSFPECGVTSIDDVMPHGARVQVALIGRDGMINSDLLLGCDRVGHEAVQICGGHSLRLDAHILKELCARFPSACRLLMRFIHALSVQTASTLVSSACHSMEERLSRLILMWHDRIFGDEIQVGHQAIARMLGVRRATVTNTLHILEGRKALRSSRGEIGVRDRALLVEIAGTSYGWPEDHYRRIIAPFGKGASGTATAGRPSPDFAAVGLF